MSIFPIGDEQQFIFNVNEEFKSIPIKISYSMEFLKSFSVKELTFAVDKCISTADVFASQIFVANSCPHMEFFPYQRKSIPVFNFANHEEYQIFCKQIRETKINNRDNLYHIFIFSIADSYYHLNFTFNHLIFDGISGLLLCKKIQELLLNPNKEIKWHPFSAHLKSIAHYKKSKKYLVDKDFWEARFFEISKSQYLFKDFININEAKTKQISFETSKKFKKNLLSYCAKKNISPHVFIVTVLAQVMNEKTGCKNFYFEIPMGNRLGRNEKNSLGIYEISPPFIFDFTKYPNIDALFDSVYKQSSNYYKHRNFDWITKISSQKLKEKYGRYVPQLCFSYLCSNQKPSNSSIAVIHHHHAKTDILPINLYVSDYLDWQTMTFCYTYWSSYFTQEEILEFHQKIENKIAKIIK